MERAGQRAKQSHTRIEHCHPAMHRELRGELPPSAGWRSMPSTEGNSIHGPLPAHRQVINGVPGHLPMLLHLRQASQSAAAVQLANPRTHTLLSSCPPQGCRKLQRAVAAWQQGQPRPPHLFQMPLLLVDLLAAVVVLAQRRRVGDEHAVGLGGLHVKVGRAGFRVDVQMTPASLSRRQQPTDQSLALIFLLLVFLLLVSNSAPLPGLQTGVQAGRRAQRPPCPANRRKLPSPFQAGRRDLPSHQ